MDNAVTKIIWQDFEKFNWKKYAKTGSVIKKCLDLITEVNMEMKVSLWWFKIIDDKAVKFTEILLHHVQYELKTSGYVKFLH